MTYSPGLLNPPGPGLRSDPGYFDATSSNGGVLAMTTVILSTPAGGAGYLAQTKIAPFGSRSRWPRAVPTILPSGSPSPRDASSFGGVDEVRVHLQRVTRLSRGEEVDLLVRSVALPPADPHGVVPHAPDRDDVSPEARPLGVARVESVRRLLSAYPSGRGDEDETHDAGEDAPVQSLDSSAGGGGLADSPGGPCQRP